jgi:HAD superfamily hydrolase (TIGR01509 family)
MFKNTDAVIFDLDGTLIDSVWLWEKIDEDFLKSFDIKAPDNLAEILEGMNFDVAAKYFKKCFNLNITEHEIKAQWNNMAQHYYENAINLKPYAKEFIEQLKAKDYRLAIATSNIKKLTLPVLDRTGIIKYFDHILTSDEINIEKPQPDIYLKAAELLNVPPQKCIAFEDTYVGVLSAKNANMYVVAVEDKHISNKKKIVKLADKYIHSYSEMLE